MGRAARTAARLAIVQALYQQEMEPIIVAQLLHQFHEHRLGATIEDATYRAADQGLFDEVVKGCIARADEIDALITEHLAPDWSFARLDRPLRAILRAGSFELVSRPQTPTGSIINDYVDVADAFYAASEKGFVNGLLDAVATAVR